MSFLVLIGVLVYGYDYDYNQKGNDWVCNETLSPINVDLNPVSILEDDDRYWYIDVKDYGDSDTNFMAYIKEKVYLTLNRTDIGTLRKMKNDETVIDTYNLEEIRFHAPSEHILGSSRSDLEVQLYHTNTNEEGDSLILSVLFNSIDSKDYRMKFFSDIEGTLEDNKKTDKANPIDVTGGYYKIKTFYNYNGTDTLPNCTKTEWVIFGEVIELYNIHLEKISSHIDGNYKDISNSTAEVNYHYADINLSAIISLGFLSLLIVS
jgi:carbonic anhydrase